MAYAPYLMFIRGAVPPPEEHPEKLLYDRIEESEDMWTQMFCALLHHLGLRGELVYLGDPRIEYSNEEMMKGWLDKVRVRQIDPLFSENWIADTKRYVPSTHPTVIICRGGLPWYDKIIRRFPSSKKVYYGAGERFFPTTDFKDYDLFLVDTPAQADIVKNKTTARVKMMLKPAAMLFEPMDVEKVYDVCFMASAAVPDIKGHQAFIKAMAGRNLRILNLGETNQRYVDMAKAAGLDITWDGWSLRRDLPSKISQCRVGVACCEMKDSSPRVIPEYLACGLPVVVSNRVQCWDDMYINDETGIKVPIAELGEGVEEMLRDLDDFKPRAYYLKRLSMVRAVERMAELVEGLL